MQGALFASVVKIACREKLRVMRVQTLDEPAWKSHRLSSSPRAGRVYSVEIKVAVWMPTHAGLGLSPVNMLLLGMSISAVCSKALKRREREVGSVIKLLAKHSWTHAVEGEVARSATANMI